MGLSALWKRTNKKLLMCVSDPLLRSAARFRWRSISLTGLSALWKRTNKKLLMCELGAALYSSFSALLFAFVDIIPYNLDNFCPFGKVLPIKANNCQKVTE